MGSSEKDNNEEGFECSICEDTFDSEDKLREHRKQEHPKKVCSKCGASLSHSPFNCNYCGETFCTEHRLPEKHDCPGLEGDKSQKVKSGDIMYMSSKENNSSEESKNNQENTTAPDSGLFNASKRKITPSLSRVNPSLGFNKKILPLLGGLLLLFISSYRNPNGFFKNGSLNKGAISETIGSAIEMIQNSIVVKSEYHLAVTLIAIFTIWSIYSYWLKDWKYTKRNSSLLEKITVIGIFLILIQRHILLDSALGVAADWTLFLMVLYMELAGTWFLMKTIDGIDLSSDLYNWGLRLLGGITILFGALMFVSSSMALTLSDSQLVFNNVYWIGSVCLMLLGAFMEYRSFRRHPAIHVW